MIGEVIMDLNSSDGVEQKPNAIYLKDYQKPDYLVDELQLEFMLGAGETIVKNSMTIRRNTGGEKNKPLVLDGQQLTLLAVELNDKPLTENDYTLTDEQLIIHQLPDTFSLSVTTKIFPEKNTALEGLYASSGMLCTQCEAEGFRRITYFIDRPDVMSRYQVKMIADKTRYPILLSNGNLIDQGELENGKHFAVWQDPSLKPSYLFALVAGELEYIEDSFTTASGRKVVLHLYTEAENIHKCDHAMHSLKQAMAWDEETYGREYDLDVYMVVAVNDFNMGAMENKGLNIFNASCVLASPETATDDDYYKIQSIIGHEYFHNWSGNRVTCRDWFQLSLKEGFTVFRDQEFSADLNSRPVERIHSVNLLRTYQFAEDSGPMAHPVRPDHYIEIGNFYTVTVYNKGAEVVRMLSNLAGKEGFRKGTDLYFSRHDGQAVTCDDFVKAIEDANGFKLNQFKNWYSQAGTPELTITGFYDTSADSYTLKVKQTTPATPDQTEKKPFHIPLAVGLLDSKGHDMPLQLEDEANNSSTEVLNITQPEQDFVFKNIKEHPVPSVLRGFSAPVKVKMERSEGELAFLLAHDNDPFNRWDAGQSLALQALMRQIDADQRNEPLPEPVALKEALSVAIEDKQIDPALLAMILSLPSESYIADQCETVDVDAIYHARLFTRHYLARALTQQLDELFKAHASQAAYTFNAKEMARRSLKNVCLAYLVETEQNNYFDLCFQQFESADNMTEVQAALGILSHHDIDKRGQALESFYAKWKHDPQVVEKWLAIQAGSRLPNTLQTIQSLLKHESFSMTNPNKVRALLGTFSRGNLHNFHASDGSGYEFLTSRILELDKMNPSIAARLVQVMARWQRFDATRKNLMHQQLVRILQQKDLSKDTYEIVSKSLQDA
jgi:aminopeptidase N